MTVKVDDVVDLGDKLKCTLCKKWLTSAPIYSDADIRQLCESCYSTSPGCQCVRAYLYESIIPYFLFPCSYQNNGFSEQLKCTEILSHEKYCAYKSKTSKALVEPKQSSLIDNQDFDCPVCMESFTPPILLCKAGHSYCQKCCSTIKICPICTVEMTTARNYVLENIINNHRQHCCPNNSVGCNFVGNNQAVCDHKIKCAFNELTCRNVAVYNCTWKGFWHDIVNHVKEHHLNKVIHLNQVTEIDISNIPLWRAYLIIRGNNIFKMYVKQITSDSPISVITEHLNPTDCTDLKFFFELEFVDVKKGGRKFVINQLCEKNVTVASSFKTCLTIPKNLLLPFIKLDKFLCFKSGKDDQLVMRYY